MVIRLSKILRLIQGIMPLIVFYVVFSILFEIRDSYNSLYSLYETVVSYTGESDNNIFETYSKLSDTEKNELFYSLGYDQHMIKSLDIPKNLENLFILLIATFSVTYFIIITIERHLKKRNNKA